MTQGYYLASAKHLSPENWRHVTECDLLCSLPEPQKVILQWEDRERFRPGYAKLRAADQLWFHFHEQTIDMTDAEMIAGWTEKALRDRDYMLCKTINEAVIEASVIRQEAALSSVPSEMQLETTDVCNARCIMCSHFYRQGTHPLDPDYALLKRLEHILPFVRTVYLHGNGEPFLLPGISEYVEVLGAYGIKLMTNTNLSIVTPEICRMINHYFKELNVSCDGASRETYEYIRQGLSFSAFLANCARVRAQCPELKMRMCSIVMRQNVHELPALVRMAAELGFQEIVFSELSSDQRLKNERDVMLHYPHVMREQLENARLAGAQCGIRVHVPTYTVQPDPAAKAKEQEEMALTAAMKTQAELEALAREISGRPKNLEKNYLDVGTREVPVVSDLRVEGICDWCVERPFIDLDGNVSVCCINQHVRLGNLNEAPFREIWNSPSAVSIRQTFYGGQLPYFCSGCEFVQQRKLRRMTQIDTGPIHHKIRLAGGP